MDSKFWTVHKCHSIMCRGWAHQKQFLKLVHFQKFLIWKFCQLEDTTIVINQKCKYGDISNDWLFLFRPHFLLTLESSLMDIHNSTHLVLCLYIQELVTIQYLEPIFTDHIQNKLVYHPSEWNWNLRWSPGKISLFLSNLNGLSTVASRSSIPNPF